MNSAVFSTSFFIQDLPSSVYSTPQVKAESTMKETHPDIPRPGDPSFTSFPKFLPEDCIQYAIHVLPTTPLSAPALRSRLLEIKRAADTLCKKVLGSQYIWQRESFNLELVGGGAGSQQWHLAGNTAFGDSIADEWVVVYLLREVSRGFEDAWVRVVDGDGEFLLVEAANALPRWLNPEVAEYRVWVNRGQLRIIPKEVGVIAAPAGKRTRQSGAQQLKLEEALAYIRQNGDETMHSPLIEEEAFYRLRNYPATIAEAMHTALLAIPRNLAFVLRRTPAHISAAVEAFYLRDPISLRPLQRKGGIKLRFPPDDLVTTSVRFTRVGYAQLKSQEFAAPAVWANALGASESDGSEAVARKEMGMKLACGFEMLVSDPQNSDKRAVREIELLLEDVESGEEKLPSDEVVKSWPQEEDDEGWLDVNYEDFERELSGKGKSGKGSGMGDGTEAFGDKAAQENLRRMVERFEQFLNDDDAGVDGATFDEMDYDDDDDDLNDDNDGSEDSDEDRDASFDEEEFAKMMREMMGMPPDDTADDARTTSGGRIEELASDDASNDEEEEEDLKKVMQRMEEELREAGALDLDPAAGGHGDGGGDDPRYQLLRNLLESFKGQGGAAGPVGNLMGTFGVGLPRDEGK